MKQRKNYLTARSGRYGTTLAVLALLATVGVGGCEWDDSAEIYKDLTVNGMATPCPPKVFVDDIGNLNKISENGNKKPIYNKDICILSKEGIDKKYIKIDGCDNECVQYENVVFKDNGDANDVALDNCEVVFELKNGKLYFYKTEQPVFYETENDNNFIAELSSELSKIQNMCDDKSSCENAGYENSIKYRLCPAGNICVYNEKGYPGFSCRFASSVCAIDQHQLSNGSCEDNSLEKCGSETNNCKALANISNSEDAIACVSGQCVIKSCASGYKLEKNQCVSYCAVGQHYDSSGTDAKCVDDDDNNCGATGYKCSEQVAHWVKGGCVNGVCMLSVVDGCESGYKVVDNACASDCVENEHYDSAQAKCIADDIKNCGATGYVCREQIKNSSDVSCDKGKCVVTSCSEGYKVNNNACVSDCIEGQQYYDTATSSCEDNDLSNCGQKGFACADKVDLWKSGECLNGICTIATCEEGFKPVANVCKADCGSEQHYNTSISECEDNDLNNCGAVGYKCSEKVAQWEDGSCTSGVCTLTVCSTGYKVVNNACASDCKTGEHYDSDAAKCVADDKDNCGATDHKCSDEIKNSSSVTCEKGKCVVSACAKGYTLTNNMCVSSCSNSQYYDSDSGSCESSDTSNCGQKGYACSSHIQNWATGNCTSNACVVSTCNKGFKPISNECKADCGSTQYYDNSTGSCQTSSINNCGQSGYKCSERVSNWADGSCTNNVCLVTSCTSGFKPTSDNKQCASNCGTGQHYDSSTSQCVADNSDNCGATDHKCSDEIKNSSSVTCEKGKCVVSACAKGYTLTNNMCVSSCSNSQYYDSASGSCKTSDTSNCGQKGYACSSHIQNWATGNCASNACVVSTCNKGFKPISNECKADCGSTQYYDNSTGSCQTSSINNCGQSGYKCSERVLNWADGSCTNNVCLVTSCISGYKPIDGVCKDDCGSNQYYDSTSGGCVDSNTTACGSATNDCTKLAGWSSGSCSSNKCVATACISGYYVNEADVCVANICPTGQINCGSTNNVQCIDPQTNSQHCGASGDCTDEHKGIDCTAISDVDQVFCNGGTSCYVGSCKNGKIVNSDHTACVECCSLGQGTCNNGVCGYTSCNSGYYLDGTTCKPYDASHCGASGTQCAVNESCLKDGSNYICKCGTNDSCSTRTDGKTLCSQAGNCVECIDNSDCLDSSKSYCNANVCVECSENGHCSSNPNGTRCRTKNCGCNNDSECLGNYKCNTAQHVCYTSCDHDYQCKNNNCKSHQC